MSVTPTQAGSTPPAATSTSPTSTLAGNFNTFLTLLTTQMQNQDPTSPLDTNQFTQQLVQFASVEQQINTNTNLTTLIGLSKASSLYQATAMIGHQVAAQSPQVSLQGSQAALQFTLQSPQPVNVSLTNATGTTVYQTALDGQAGTNGWVWNGQTSDGRTAPDGLYNVSVTTGSGAASPVPFSVIGTATGVSTDGTTPSLSLGGLTVPISAVSAVIQ